MWDWGSLKRLVVLIIGVGGSLLKSLFIVSSCSFFLILLNLSSPIVYFFFDLRWESDLQGLQLF